MGWVIASEAAAAVLADARSRHPQEACGLLLGEPGVVRRAISASNVATRPDRTFEIDPATLLRVHREARGTGEAVVGHYHSHPDGNGTLSKTDAARAAQDGQLWLLAAGGALSAWLRTADGFAPIAIS